MILTDHSSKPPLGSHPCAEPIELFTKTFQKEHLKIITLKIGEQINLKDNNQIISKWWKTIV